MRHSPAIVTSAAMAALLLAGPGPEAADFDPRVVTFGQARQEIKSTPVAERPNRPLHVYGNTVRRRTDRAARPGAKAPR